MKNSQDMRDDAIKRMVAALKEVRRAEKLLGKPKMHRVFKDKSCKSAKSQSESLWGLRKWISEAEVDMWCAWMTLPEVENDPNQPETFHEQVAAAKAFAAACAKKPRRVRFLKGQMVFAEN